MCPMCESARTGPAYEDLTLQRCDSCGLVWRPERDDAARLYEGAFLEAGGYYNRYFERAEQWRHEARIRLRWLLTETTPGSVLELGCAGGFFLEAARSAGIQAEGVEPSEDGVRFAQEQLQVPVIKGTVEEVVLTGPFDAVCAFHVLEHVTDPRAFLGRARSLLSPDGTLALEVPNIASTRARQDGPTWFNLAPDHHCWHFSPSTLSRLLGESGFDVVRWDTVFPRTYFRARRLLTPSGLKTYLADLRCTPSAARAPSDAGDYLRVLARVT